MIEASEVSKYYGRFCAVRDLSFKIAQGEVVGLLGPNGAGKTTTMRLLTGYMPPTAGRIRLAGHDLFNEPQEAKRCIGYLPETPPLYPELTVTEYLSFAARLHGLRRREARSAVDEAIERAGLQEVRRQLIGQLSRGFQQRVGLGQVLAKKAPILILDEPTSGLDPKQIHAIRQLITELGGDYTVILSSHILQEVSATCQRVIIIHRGQIVAQDRQENLLQVRQGEERFLIKIGGGSVDEIRDAFAALSNMRVQECSAEGSLVRLCLTTPQLANFHEQVFAVLKQKSWVPHEIAQDRTSLEDVFLSLTQEAETPLS